MRNNVKHFRKPKNMNMGLRMDKNLRDRLIQAAEKTHLSSSDLLREGALRVVNEIEETGTLTLSQKSKPEKPQKKSGKKEVSV